MSSATLNFNTDNLITGINVIDGQLYWTDDRNEPRTVNIEDFKAANHSSGTTNIYNRSFLDRDITVIRPHPFQVPSLTTTASSAVIDRPFRDIFPKFSYRWRYNDGKYSPFAPFTETAFVADGVANIAFPSVNFASYDEGNSFEEGINSNMHNGITSITLSNIPVGGPDVVSVDILYTESISSTIYAIDTRTPIAAETTAGILNPIVINKRSLTGALPANQLIRPFDNVPRLAKAQEITANRLIYGNYLQNYDQPDTVAMTTSVVVDPGTIPIPGLSVKTNRTYEVGIAFIDEFGRQGGLITSNSATVSTPFFAPNRLDLAVQIDTATTTAPSWATHYRYYVKDSSNEHFNLVSSNAYFDTDADVSTPSTITSTYIWLGFNSKDRNKITEDTVLMPKRHTQGNAAGVLFEGPSLHPILEISNEIPEILLVQAETTAGATDDATRLTARQDALEQAQGQFFVKVKRATDSGSGGGDFLSTGESVRTVASGTVSTTSQFYTVTFFVFGVLTLDYTDVTTGMAATATFGPGSSRLESRTLPVVATGSAVASATIIPDSVGIISSFEPTVGGALNQTWFETVPIGNSALDLYWETSNTFAILPPLNADGTTNVLNNYGNLNTLSWSNCYGFTDILSADLGLFIESVRIGDEFNSVLMDRGVRVNTPQESYEEDRRGTGLIFSGLFNDRTGINRLNEFIFAEGITQELLPNYGTIQKLHTRDNYLISLCESKIFRTLADKDQLFNADGNINVTATSQVLGDTSPVIGEYGISQNPESFATYANNIYFTDSMRGAVMQYTPNNGQLFEISQQGMSDFFRDRFASANPNFKAVGSFNDYKNSYILSVQNYDQADSIIGSSEAFTDRGSQTAAYDLDTKRWPSRYSFIPEGGISLNNRFYTWSNGRLWIHNSTDVVRNNFYGTQYETTWDIIVNADTPSVVKNFVALGYEGDADWELTELSTDLEGTTDTLGFIEKEGKYVSAISGTENIYEIIGSVGSVTQQPTDVVNNGFVLRQSTRTRRTSGIKGLFATVRFRNTQTAEREIHAINTTFFDSSF